MAIYICVLDVFGKQSPITINLRLTMYLISLTIGQIPNTRYDALVGSSTYVHQRERNNDHLSLSSTIKKVFVFLLFTPMRRRSYFPVSACLSVHQIFCQIQQIPNSEHKKPCVVLPSGGLYNKEHLFRICNNS